MEESLNERTLLWQQYEIGKNYNRHLNLYEEGTDNYNFYHGRQWEGLEKPKKYGDPIVLNIVKPIVKFKVNVVNANSYQVVFNPNSYNTPDELSRLKEVCKGLTQFISKIWEKAQTGKQVRDIVKTACINSEGIIHFFEDNNTINSEEIDKNNIYYGNEVEENIQKQPYILLTYRKPVSEIRKRAKTYKEKRIQ